MCIQMTDAKWFEMSQEEDPSYILKETRYNADGQTARIYVDDDNYVMFAVFPGIENHQPFYTQRTTMDQAIAYIAAAGYTLTEDPRKTTAPALTIDPVSVLV